MNQVRVTPANAPASAMPLALGCLTGILLVTGMPALPPVPVTLLCAGVAIGLRRWPNACALILGAALAVIASERRLDDRLNARIAGTDLTFSARIADFPDIGTVIRLDVLPLDRADLSRRIRLSWYDAERIPEYGECWTLTARLRRPRGFSNPARFDYERWLFEQNIGATGYVKSGDRRDDCDDAGAVRRLRSQIHDRLSVRLPDDDARAILLAISVGVRHSLTDDQWQAFSVTGTSHLMAISGLHIALAAGLFFGVARCVLAVMCLPVNHRITAGLLAATGAAIYAAVSGFSIPAQRALLMLGLGVAALLLRRRLDAWQTTGLAALGMLLLNPVDGMTIGFRLSFLAVALLLLLAARHSGVHGPVITMGTRLRSHVKTLGLLQVTLLFGMLPLAVDFFGRVAWVSPMTNLLVVPLFNVVTLPAALAGAILDNGVGDWLLLVAWRSAGYAAAIIDRAASLPAAPVTVPTMTYPGKLALLAAALYAVLPAGWPGRGVSVIGFLFVLLQRPTAPPHGCVDIHVLDVGQGLATLIRTNTRVALYDAGPAFRSGSDTGRLVAVPYLREAGVDALDLMVVSHGDNDHAGGVMSVLDDVSAAATLTGEEPEGPLKDASTPFLRCSAGQLWHWDGIHFAVLHPPVGSRIEGNNASCVIEIRAGQNSTLLTGDIEAVAERSLLAEGLVSDVDFVLVPHHGSKTSSVLPFVDATSAETAVVSAGHANRWGMPRPEIVQRWSSSGAQVVNTADSGAVLTRMCVDADRGTLLQQRKDRQRFWHER